MNPKLSLFIGIICISFSPIFVKLAGVSPVSSAFFRIFMAWLVLAPYCLIAKVNLKIGRKALLIAIAGGIVFATDMMVWNISLLKISATVSTLLANLAPLWVGLLSYLLFKKHSGLLFWLGTFLAVAGMIILVGYQNILHLQFNAGILLALLASLLYAIYIMITGGVLQQISTLTFMFYNMLASSVVLAGFYSFQTDSFLHFSAFTWFCLGATGLVCQLTGWITINYSLKFLDATKVAVALLTQTVIAGYLAMLLLHEQLQLKEIIGSAVVLAGIGVTFVKTKRAAFMPNAATADKTE